MPNRNRKNVKVKDWPFCYPKLFTHPTKSNIFRQQSGSWSSTDRRTDTSDSLETDPPRMSVKHLSSQFRRSDWRNQRWNLRFLYTRSTKRDCNHELKVFTECESLLNQQPHRRVYSHSALASSIHWYRWKQRLGDEHHSVADCPVKFVKSTSGDRAWSTQRRPIWHVWGQTSYSVFG